MEQRYVSTGFKFEAPYKAEPPSLYSLPAQNRISQEEFDDLWRRLYSKTKFVIILLIAIVCICLICSFAPIALTSHEEYLGLYITLEVFSLGLTIGLLLFLLCATKKILTRIANKENEQYWIQRGMKWEVIYQLNEYGKYRYYFQLLVVPNTVDYLPKKEEYSDERKALREALIA